MRPFQWSLAVGLMAGVVVIGACSVSPGDLVTVRFQEWSIDVDTHGADPRSGRMQFEIDNVGSLEHDLALVRASEPGDLDVTPEGELDLSANRPIDDIEAFAPGFYRAVSPNVLAGDYLIVCTLTTTRNGRPQNHFAQGMWAKLTIVQKGQPD